MLSLYLFSLVLGGGFLLASLFGGEGSDVDVDVDVDLDLDLDVHGDFDTHGMDADHHGVASKILSFRTVVYGLFGFGATGSLLTWLGSGFGATLAFASVGGLLSGALVGSVFRYLKRTDSGAAPGDAALIGLTGRVTLSMSGTAPGSIVVERGHRRVTLRALPHGSVGGNPTDWKAVVVVEMDRGVARVAPLEGDELQALPSSPYEPD